MGEALTDLSVLIPSRNEIFLKRTIDDLLANMRGDTEIIAILDGQWADPPIPDHPRVTLVYHPVPIGQRAATNEAARMARGKYVMKCDAHCAFDVGFDVKLMADCEPDWTVIPRMYNLHAFDWVCACGHRTYQGPKRCEKCGSLDVTMDIVWERRLSRRTDFARFDKDLHFQYWRDYEKRPGAKGDIADVMCSVGACWFMHKERYFELGGMDETHGSWGQMGVEVACKAWLSGGRQVVNKKTWFSHMFRTQDGFGFPYQISGSEQERAREYSRHLWQGGHWDRAIRPLSWIIDKFAPVPDWGLSKGVLCYTCNTHREDIELACRAQLKRAASGLEIGCVSLKDTDYGDWQITLPLERSPLTMHKQILAGLERMTSDVVFLCESDVLYHPSHFQFIPPQRDTFYYNTNLWRVRYDDGLAVWTDGLQQLSGICAYRELLLDFFKRRVKRIERDGFNRHYEPNERNYGARTENWQSEYPNLDIRHSDTITRSKWSADEFRDKSFAAGWAEADKVPGWGVTAGRMGEILAGMML